VLADFEDGVEGAPEVGNFVFEEAADEWEDAVDGLGELEKRWVVCGLGVDFEGEYVEEGWGGGGKRDASLRIVKGA